MNKKRFSHIILVILVVASVGTLGYIYFSTKSVSSKRTKQPTITQTTTTYTDKQSGSIEKVDFLKYLAQKHESENPTKGSGFCPIGSTELWQSGYAKKSIEYGYVTGNNTEVAIVNYRTCWSGTGGSNSEVYMLDSNGDLVDITPDSTRLSQAENKKFFDGFAGHGYFGINESNLIFTYPIYKAGDSNASPTGGMTTITFKWNGEKFIYDTISINPSAH